MTADPVPGRRELHFCSGTDRCHAWLYLPTTPPRLNLRRSSSWPTVSVQ